MNLILLGFLLVVGCSCCPTGWVKFEENCYWFERSRKLNWQSAKNQCISMNGFLIKIYSDRENSFIRSELTKLHPGNGDNDQYWTAANDIQKEGTFVWAGSNDLVSEYTDWSPGEPNQHGGQEDCVTFYPALQLHWNDEHCDKRELFICEQLDMPVFG